MSNPLTGNRKAFLDMLAESEGTSTNPLTKNDGYDVIVTGVDGPEIFTDYFSHPFAPDYPGNLNRKRPSKVIDKHGLTSTASGRYQFMYDNPSTKALEWDYYRDQLGLPDFGPDSQDQWALQLIRERQALPLIDGGSIQMAIERVRNLWASLPGAGYGQHENKLDKLLMAYKYAGGMVA